MLMPDIQTITYRSMWPVAMLTCHFPQYHFQVGLYGLVIISWGMVPTSSPLGAMSFLVCLVYVVCPVCLVYLVHLVSFVQPKNQTNEIETRSTRQLAIYREGAAAPGLAEPGLPWRRRSGNQETRNQEEVLIESAPESRCHWVLRRESSPVSPHT